MEGKQFEVKATPQVELERRRRCPKGSRRAGGRCVRR